MVRRGTFITRVSGESTPEHGPMSATISAAIARMGSEHFQLGPVKDISDGALDFGVPGSPEDPDQLPDAIHRDNVDVVEVGYRGAAEPLPPPQRNLLRNASHRGGDLGDDDLREVLVGRGSRQEQDRAPTNRLGKVGPPDLVLSHRRRRGRGRERGLASQTVASRYASFAESG